MLACPAARRPPALPVPRRSRRRSPRCSQRLGGALDWPAASPPAPRPGCRRCATSRRRSGRMESLLREYPISQRRGPGADAAGRSAAARARCRNRDRADGRPARPRRFRRRRRRRCAAPLAGQPVGQRDRAVEEAPARRDGEPPGLLERLGARTVVAATVRAIQLLGRQFVLGRHIDEAMDEAAAQRAKQPALRFATTCSARARAPSATRCATWRPTTTRSDAHRAPRQQRAPATPERSATASRSSCQRAALALRGRAARARVARTGAARVAADRAARRAPTST